MNSENKLIDTDGDGLADEDDLDDDGDGWTDLDEIKCASLGYDASSVPIDTDNDGICDFMDQDNDGDGVLDAIDLFPYNSNESVDFDNDGMGNVGDLDDDDDGWSDIDEVICNTEPLNFKDWPLDHDGDWLCDLIDFDDDGDGWSDVNETICQTNSLDSTSIPPDTDNDGNCNLVDLDDDGDEWTDINETICQTDPLDSTSIPLDSDGDLVCDVIDPDLESLLYEWRRWWRIEALFQSNPELIREDIAMNMITWQMEHGGWEKYSVDYYLNEWNGSIDISYNTNSGEDLGSFKDMATTAHIRFIAQAYSDTNDSTRKQIFKASVESGISFILDAQHTSGGWPGVWPVRWCVECSYSNLMTFNDHVMTTVVLLLWDLVEQRNQFSSGILDSINSTQLSMALDAGMQFILDTQIIVNGTPTIWAQQYNRSTLEPESARSWELPCRTPNESEGIVAILLNWPDRTPEIINATWGAVEWDENNAIEDLWFDKSNGTIIESEGSLMFYRYYNVSDDQFFLANSQSEKIYSLYDLYPEVKRTTYRWAGEWGSEMLVETRKIAVEDRH